ncbi:hypothetical protein HNQ93_000724 [Hymenobacter luteus]|uniref:DUF4136 domain-containing protein n=2 Tax=Hymenobacter TaxID=89966 RepID=A0A7W9W9Q0_9BACT|nr:MULTISPECIES: hypothetical protein [Hymenobacter]MBB4599796.1 hypothetical protein [Hymenobacter latericoloratus]MBB6057894.1 hypothetical protein [Hymenobacter luteus]
MLRLFFGLLLLATACAPARYAAHTLNAPALVAHRTVAILPFEVTQDRLRLRDIHYIAADTSGAALQRVQQEWHDKQRREGQAVAYQLQALLQARLREQQPPLGYSVQFQEVAETNRRLQQAGISYATLPEQSMEQLRQVLGVDAILSGQTDLYQPLPAGLGFAARALLQEPLLGSTAPSAIPSSQATTNLTLHDCRTGQLVWRFDFERLGNAALRPTRLTRDLVRTSAAGFPYRKK